MSSLVDLKDFEDSVPGQIMGTSSMEILDEVETGYDSEENRFVGKLRKEQHKLKCEAANKGSQFDRVFHRKDFVLHCKM